MRALPIALVALLSTIPSVVRAGVDVGGPVVVRVDDAYADDCMTHAFLLDPCFVDIREDGETNWTIDARQQYELVGLAANPSYFPFVGQYVPSAGFWAQGNQTYVPFAALEGVRDAYAEIPQERPYRDAAGLSFTKENVTVYMAGPLLLDPTGPSGNRSYGFDTGADDGGWLSYEKLGPFNEGVVTSTDIQIATAAPVLCDMVRKTADCTAVANSSSAWYVNNTPNLVLGFEWQNVTVATNATYLSNGSGSDAAPSWPMPLRGARAAAPPLRKTPTQAMDPLYFNGPRGEPPSIEPPEVAGPRPLPPRGPSLPGSPTSPEPAPAFATIVAGLALSLALQALYSRLHASSVKPPTRLGVSRG